MECNCGKVISIERLKAMPGITVCVECAKKNPHRPIGFMASASKTDQTLCVVDSGNRDAVRKIRVQNWRDKFSIGQDGSTRIAKGNVEYQRGFHKWD